MERLKPLNDWAFKKIFGETKDKHLLIGLLSAIINEEIEDLTILSEELYPERENEKWSKLDLKARLASGEKVNIEVQLKNEYNMRERTLFYWAKLFTADFYAGEEYQLLEKTITINILNFSIIDNVDYHNRFHIYHDQTKQLLTDKLAIHFIELPKFNREAPNIHHPLERWLLFLDDHTSKESLEEVIQVDQLIKEAEKKLEILKQDPKAREQYEMIEKYLHDYYSAVGGARREGVAAGRKEGREEGREQAIKQVAKALLAKRMSYEEIRETTGLSLTQIEALDKSR